MKRKLILLVDDDKSYCQTMEEVLEEEGYLVKLAGNAETAGAIMERIGHWISLILLDIEMPGLNGVEFMQQLERDGKQVPVVFVSSKVGMKQDFDVVTAKLVKDFITKPFELNDLLARLPGYMREPEIPERPAMVALAEYVHEYRTTLEAELESGRFVVKPFDERMEMLEFIKRVGTHVECLVLNFQMLGGTPATRKEFMALLSRWLPGAPIVLFYDAKELVPMEAHKQFPNVVGQHRKPGNITEIRHELRQALQRLEVEATS